MVIYMKILNGFVRGLIKDIIFLEIVLLQNKYKENIFLKLNIYIYKVTMYVRFDVEYQKTNGGQESMP